MSADANTASRPSCGTPGEIGYALAEDKYPDRPEDMYGTAQVQRPAFAAGYKAGVAARDADMLALRRENDGLHKKISKMGAHSAAHESRADLAENDLRKILRHLDNGATSPSECLCLIRVVVEDRLSALKITGPDHAEASARFSFERLEQVMIRLGFNSVDAEEVWNALTVGTP